MGGVHDHKIPYEAGYRRVYDFFEFSVIFQVWVRKSFDVRPQLEACMINLTVTML